MFDCRFAPSRRGLRERRGFPEKKKLLSPVRREESFHYSKPSAFSAPSAPRRELFLRVLRAIAPKPVLSEAEGRELFAPTRSQPRDYTASDSDVNVKSRVRIAGTTIDPPGLPLSLALTRTGRVIASRLFSMKIGDSL